MHDEFVKNIVALHSQQAVEKSFKALMEELEIAVPRIHNLTRLHSLVADNLAKPINMLELDALDNVYTTSRYPSDLGLVATGKPTQQEAIELYELAKRIFEILVQSINQL